MMGHKFAKQTKMRDGTVVEDPRLARLFEQDPKSRDFDIADKLTAPLTSKTWYGTLRLSQGNTEACTGNARTHDLAFSPNPLRLPNGQQFDEDFAQALYHLAQKYDQWPGEDYGGSSVLGAAKAALHLGFIGEYRWAFNIDDMLRAIATIGPVVCGTTWMNSMFDPLPTGELVIDPSSGEAGGHSYTFRGVIVGESTKIGKVGKDRNRKGVPLMRLTNSWFPWGINGECFVWADDYESHLMPDGDQCVTTTAFHR